MNNARFKIIVGIAIGIAALAFFLQGIQWKDLMQTLSAVKLHWVALAAFILLGEFVIRAWRWKVLLSPLGITARFTDLFVAQVIGAGTNILFPARAGELTKPLVASKRTNQPFSTIAATTIIERVYDILGMISVLCLMLFVLAPDINTSGENAELVGNLKLYGGIFGGFAASCMVIFFVLAAQKNTAHVIFERIVAIAPTPIRNKLLEMFDGFVYGLSSASDRTAFWKAGALSIWMWVNGALAIYCLFQAFGMTLPFGAACFVGVAIALAVALPQAPGFIGVFQVAMEKTMLLWNQSPSDAVGFAILFWAVSFIPVTALFFAIIIQGRQKWSDLFGSNKPET